MVSAAAAVVLAAVTPYARLGLEERSSSTGTSVGGRVRRRCSRDAGIRRRTRLQELPAVVRIRPSEPGQRVARGPRDPVAPECAPAPNSSSARLSSARPSIWLVLERRVHGSPSRRSVPSRRRPTRRRGGRGQWCVAALEVLDRRSAIPTSSPTFGAKPPELAGEDFVERDASERARRPRSVTVTDRRDTVPLGSIALGDARPPSPTTVSPGSRTRPDTPRPRSSV